MRRAAICSVALLWTFAAGCGGSGEPEAETAPTAADPAAGPLLLVSNEDGGTLSVVATTTHEVLAEIEVGRRPRGVRASPDGGMAYVAVSGSPKCPPWMEEEGCAEPDKRFDGTRLSAYGSYLLDDLRLDPARLAVLARDRLDAIARAYDSRKLYWLMRYLQTLREQSHA